MRRFIVRVLATIGALVVLFIVAGVALALWGRSAVTRIADNTVLALDVGDGFTDAPPTDAFSDLLFPGRPPLRDVLDALERAGDDPRVRGLIATVGDGSIGAAQAQELRDAIAAFRAKGKRAVAYADSFGELSSGTQSYYLASAFDEIWLQPHGIVGLTGLYVGEPFLRGTLDKLGIVARFDHREEYKSAADPLLERAMTEPDRQQITDLLHSVYDQIVRGIAADRKLDAGAVQTLVDRGPLLAQEALDAHLVDHLGYSDQVLAALGVSPDGDTRPMPVTRYLDAAGRPHQSGPTVALIYASGLIQSGGSSGNPLSGSATLGADTVIRGFREAERDPDVRAILFRIDSPGGAATAAESIWRETARAREHGKKVIVSMGAVAGSGGYYIAADADTIVAEPATLTGSIGVVAGKVLIGGLLDKIGAGWSAVQQGANANLSSPVEDFTPDGYRRFQAELDDIYAVFKERVAQGRRLDAGAVEEVAKGRIWSGADAKAKGLVDVLGGYATALGLAKKAAGAAPDRDVTIKVFPPPESAADLVADRLFGRTPGDNGDTSTFARTLGLLAPLVARLELLASNNTALLMAPVEIR